MHFKIYRYVYDLEVFSSCRIVMHKCNQIELPVCTLARQAIIKRVTALHQ